MGGKGGGGRWERVVWRVVRLEGRRACICGCPAGAGGGRETQPVRREEGGDLAFVVCGWARRSTFTLAAFSSACVRARVRSFVLRASPRSPASPRTSQLDAEDDGDDESDDDDGDNEDGGSRAGGDSSSSNHNKNNSKARRLAPDDRRLATFRQTTLAHNVRIMSTLYVGRCC
jgi:hypothetical protein